MNLEQWLGTQLGQDIWEKKYQQNGESLDQWLDRVSGGNEDIKQLIVDKKFLFGGRILASRGITDRKVTYSNCYVLPRVEDSIEGIYDTAKHLARTFSYGGGVGIDISDLRPKGSPVNNAAKTTSGAVSFMDTFSQVSSVIGQAGRRGALMISMNVHHPDIDDFIDAKKNTDKLEGCNISVKTDEEFMDSVFNKDPEANRLMDKLAYNNWDYAEPGMLFWDNINYNNLLSEYIKEGEFEYAGVNPCAEEPLPAGGSCLLGALNLSAFVIDEFGKKPAFDLPEFKKAVKIAVRGLNEVLDEGLSLHPLEIQRETVRDWRQIGLGIMGFGDLLIKMKIRYGSDRCLKLIQQIGDAMINAGIQESASLAEELGAFPKYKEQYILDSAFMSKVSRETRNAVIHHGLRNSQLFTIAPTGSIATMLDISGGIEPLFDVAYTRTTKSLHDEDVTYVSVPNIIQKVMEVEGIEEIDRGKLPEYVTWAKRLSPIDRVVTQGAWQYYIDASISSTVNLANNVTVDEVKEIYKMAWLKGCKGLTIFRDGCARLGILNAVEEPKKDTPALTEEINIDLAAMDIAHCIAAGDKIITGCGSLWITAYFHRTTGQLCHIFLNKGSQGGCNSYMIGLSRMISLAGKKGASLDEIIDQLNSVVPCASYVGRTQTKGDTAKGNSCPSAIGKTLRKLYKQFEVINDSGIIPEVVEETTSTNICPECGGELQQSGGCISCPECGYSKCD